MQGFSHGCYVLLKLVRLAQASPHRGACLQQLYADIQCAAKDTVIRFRGCFTDGGCDNSMAQYWVNQPRAADQDVYSAPTAKG